MNQAASDRNIIAFRDTHITVRNTASGEQTTLFVSCDPSGMLLVADAEADVPRFHDRRKLESYPSEEMILAIAGELLGSRQDLVSVEYSSIELDRSALAGLKKMPVDIFDDVYLGQVQERALVLCVDIRGFSNFLCNNEDEAVFALIQAFTTNLLSCVNQFGYGCSYYKLMGDGAIVIWDETTEETVNAALMVFDSYICFLNDELFKPYPGLGMAGALVMDKVFKYEISAEASQLKYRDYVGYGINLSCRIQGLARKDQLIINQHLADTGLVRYCQSETPELLKDLRSLKGLKDEDRKHVLVYTPGCADTVG